MMGLEAWAVLAVLLGVLVLLALTDVGPDFALLGGLAVLMVLGIVSPREALAGMAEPALLTVAALFVVDSGIRETGALHLVVDRVFGRPRSVARAQLRVMLPVAATSAFMNNTPLVAMLLPAVTDWSRKMSLSPSKLLMPLSFATILGGLATKIGIGTNVIMSGLMQGELGRPMGMFELAWIGVPATAAGIVYMLAASRLLLPERNRCCRSSRIHGPIPSRCSSSHEAPSRGKRSRRPGCVIFPACTSSRSIATSSSSPPSARKPGSWKETA